MPAGTEQEGPTEQNQRLSSPQDCKKVGKRGDNESGQFATIPTAGRSAPGSMKARRQGIAGVLAGFRPDLFQALSSLKIRKNESYEGLVQDGRYRHR
jgi:hypothetical protein